MATITTNTSFDTLTRTAAESFDVRAGAILTIDVDPRYSKGAPAGGSGILGGLASTTTGPGGTIFIDGRNVRWIPYTDGLGFAPGYNASVYQPANTGSGILMHVTSGIQFAPVASGAAMPTTGFLKLKSKTGDFKGGFLVSGVGLNFACTPSSADVTGWLEIPMQYSGTVDFDYKECYFKISGAWFDLGTTNGVAGQIIQAPNYGGTNTYYPGVWISSGVGSLVYDRYPAVLGGAIGTSPWVPAANSGIGTDARGKFVEAMSDGRFRIGSDGTNNVGYLPPSGCAIRIPNVLLTSSTSQARSLSMPPNAVLASRPDFTIAAGAMIDVDKAMSDWYFNLTNAYQVRLTNFAYFDSLYLYTNIGSIYFDNVQNGCYSYALDIPALYIYYSYGGSEFYNCSFGRGGTISSSDISVSITSAKDITFSGCTFAHRTQRTAICQTLSISASENANFYECITIGGHLSFSSTTNSTVRGVAYADNLWGTTTNNSTNPYGVLLIGTASNNIVMDGYLGGAYGLANVHPYGYIVRFDGSVNCRAKNIGTRENPYDMGTIIPYTHAFYQSAGSRGDRIQRCYVKNTATAFVTGSPGSVGLTVENCAGDYADVTGFGGTSSISSSCIVKSLACASAATGANGTFGTHFYTLYNNVSSGQIGIMFSEAVPETAPYVDFQKASGISSRSCFLGNGTLSMYDVGDSVTYTWPHKILGFDSFENAAAVLTGTNTTNHIVQYALDTGTGYGDWLAASGVNLSAETLPSPSIGFGLKLKFSCITASTTNNLTSAYIKALADTTAQDVLYPLDTYTLSFTGLQEGSKLAILQNTQEILIETLTSSGGTASYTYADTFAGTDIDIAILTSGYYYQKLEAYTLTAADASIPVAQEQDLVYSASMASGTYFAYSGTNHRIYGNSGLVTGGQFTFDIQNIYSEWVNWAMQGDNLKYYPAFDATGGDNIGGGQTVGKYIFLNNYYWRLVPPNVSPLDVIVDGSLYGSVPTTALIAMISGNTTSFQIRNSALTIGINTAGSTLTAADVWTHPVEGSFTAEQVQRLLLAVAAGTTNITDLGGGNANVEFYAQNGTTVRVSGQMTGSERTTMNLNGA